MCIRDRNKNLQNSKKGLLSTFLGAFFFAIILWLFVISEKNYSYVFEMPIEVRNIREGKTLGGEVSPTADVRFRATGRELLKALLLKSISDFKLVLDLERVNTCLLYTSPSPRDRTRSRMPSSA